MKTSLQLNEKLQGKEIHCFTLARFGTAFSVNVTILRRHVTSSGSSSTSSIYSYNHSPVKILNEMARAIVLTSCEETVKYPQ
jgi:hypothetical protein